MKTDYNLNSTIFQKITYFKHKSILNVFKFCLLHVLEKDNHPINCLSYCLMNSVDYVIHPKLLRILNLQTKIYIK